MFDLAPVEVENPARNYTIPGRNFEFEKTLYFLVDVVDLKTV